MGRNPENIADGRRFGAFEVQTTGVTMKKNEPTLLTDCTHAVTTRCNKISVHFSTLNEQYVPSCLSNYVELHFSSAIES